MDEASAEYMRQIADSCYQGALAYDKRDDFGDQDMVTAHLEAAQAILTELKAAGHPLVRS